MELETAYVIQVVFLHVTMTAVPARFGNINRIKQ